MSVLDVSDAIDEIIHAATCLSLMAEADSELDGDAVMWLAGQIIQIAKTAKKCTENVEKRACGIALDS